MNRNYDGEVQIFENRPRSNPSQTQLLAGLNQDDEKHGELHVMVLRSSTPGDVQTRIMKHVCENSNLVIRIALEVESADRIGGFPADWLRRWFNEASTDISQSCATHTDDHCDSEPTVTLESMVKVYVLFDPPPTTLHESGINTSMQELSTVISQFRDDSNTKHQVKASVSYRILLCEMQFGYYLLVVDRSG